MRKHFPFFFALSFLLIVRGTFADQNYIPSGSMEPTIHIGDHILVDKTAYAIKVPFTGIELAKTGEPQRGDILVFFRPADGMRMIKRVVGLPGDRITIRDGFISVNGEAIPGSEVGERQFLESPQDEILYEETLGSHQAMIRRIRSQARAENDEYIVPANHYFAMGDNRDNSADSRSWGFFPRENIQGRAVGVIYNLAWTPLPSFDLSRIAKQLD